WLFLHAPKIKGMKTKLNGEYFTYTGSGRFDHAQMIGKILFPDLFEWHEWSLDIMEEACTKEWLFISGCGASSKSTTIGLYALEWWMSSPTTSAVIIASKTIESAKKRIWREIARLYNHFSSILRGYKDAAIGSSPRPYICPIVGA